MAQRSFESSMLQLITVNALNAQLALVTLMSENVD